MNLKQIFSKSKIYLPFILWLILFRDFFFGLNPINHDTILSYGVVKFFVNNILNGVFPLWDPFLYLGTPFYSLVFVGLFSPLIYVMAVLVLLGLNYYKAYLAFLFLNFWLGCLGYYFWSNQLLKNKFFS